jgi:hypothetical protein
LGVGVSVGEGMGVSVGMDVFVGAAAVKAVGISAAGLVHAVTKIAMHAKESRRLSAMYSSNQLAKNVRNLILGKPGHYSSVICHIF